MKRRVLEITFCLIVFCFMFNKGHAQAKRITTKFENESLVSVLEKLEAISGRDFFYQRDSVMQGVMINDSFAGATLEGILDKILNGNGFRYEIEGNVVLINRGRELTDVPKRILGQEGKKIEGRVTDKNGEPLPGVTVLVKNTRLGVVTDVDGKFELTLPGEGGVLQFSFIGMKGREVQIKDFKPLQVVLEEDVTEMEEVVVTGIFNRPRESFTGAVKTVSAKELKNFRGQNLLSTLRNIDPSINMVIDNTLGSNPNREVEITIRGNSSLPTSLEEAENDATNRLNAPLVIVDGFEVTIQKLQDFNDEEIESINILKDASATAIYGSRGANGVIVIKTKDPQPGKLKVFFQGGVNLEIPDLSSYDLMNAKDKLSLERMVGLYDAGTPYEDALLKQLYNERLTDALMGETEWIRIPVRVGIGRRLNLRLEGGSEEFRWSASLSNNLTKGVMKGSERNASNASITLSYNYKNLIFRNVVSFDTYKADNGTYGSFATYARLNTYFRAKDEEGRLIKSWTNFPGYSDISNPLVDARLDGENYSRASTIRNIFSIDWTIARGLSLKGQLGISKSFSNKHKYLPAEHSSFSYPGIDTFAKGTYDYTTGEGFAIDGNLTLNYSTVLNEKHSIYTGVYATIMQSKDFAYSFSVQGLLNKNFKDFANALSYKTGTVPSGTDNRAASVGFTGNINYTYDSRYYIDASIRVDGSSQFGRDKRFAPFWSLGLGWNIHNEKFMDKHALFSTFRLRLSLGESGSQQFAPYQARSMYSFSTESRYLVWTSTELMGLGNEKLSWQTTIQYNAGMDVELFNGRLLAGVDCFYKKTRDLLSTIDLKLVHGFNGYTENIGSTENVGYEAMFGGYILRNSGVGLTWNVTGKLAYTRNKILTLSDELKRETEKRRQTSEYGTLFYEGRSQNSIYAVRSQGINPADGKELFLDAEGNVTKTWDPSYRVYCGVGEPTFRGSLNSLISYKNLSFNLSFGFHWGGKQYNSTLLDKVEVPVGLEGSGVDRSIINNVDNRVFTERWQKAGDYKFFKGYSDEATRSSSRFVMDDKVFQLQSLSLQYSWRTGFVKKVLHAETVNLSVNMSDLFYLSSIKRERGTDYPFANNIQFAFSVIF